VALNNFWLLTTGKKQSFGLYRKVAADKPNVSKRSGQESPCAVVNRGSRFCRILPLVKLVKGKTGDEIEALQAGIPGRGRQAGACTRLITGTACAADRDAEGALAKGGQRSQAWTWI
jgi:hypothetical protein